MINKLKIVSGYKEGRSYLKDTFYTRPFRVANICEDKSDPSLYLMIMSSSPGMLDNDHHDINIHVETGSRLLLESQSYQRLFNMECGAQQFMEISLEPGSAFSYIQYPVVPHENSIFKAHNIVHLSDKCSYTFGEIVTCGRKHSGEEFRYSKFQNLTEVFFSNKLILKDNVLLQPLITDVHGLGQMEGFTHQGTLMHVHIGDTDIESAIESAYTFLQSQPDIAFGVSQPFADCMMIRILGNGGEQIYNAFRYIQWELWQKGNSKEEDVPKAVSEHAEVAMV
jgi:urease accessory protein